MTKWQLMMAFLNRQPITIRAVEFIVLNSIEHEDGSKSSFNVTGMTRDDTKTVHIKTID